MLYLSKSTLYLSSVYHRHLYLEHRGESQRVVLHHRRGIIRYEGSFETHYHYMIEIYLYLDLSEGQQILIQY